MSDVGKPGNRPETGRPPGMSADWHAAVDHLVNAVQGNQAMTDDTTARTQALEHCSRAPTEAERKARVEEIKGRNRNRHPPQWRDVDFFLSELARVEAERDEARKGKVSQEAFHSMVCERDAALARAEEAEVENMELRRMLMTRVGADRLSEANMLLSAALAQVQQLREALSAFVEGYPNREWEGLLHEEGCSGVSERLIEVEDPTDARPCICDGDYNTVIVRAALAATAPKPQAGPESPVQFATSEPRASREPAAVSDTEPKLTDQQATEAAALWTLTREAPPDAPGVDPDFATEPKPLSDAGEHQREAWFKQGMPSGGKVVMELQQRITELEAKVQQLTEELRGLAEAAQFVEKNLPDGAYAGLSELRFRARNGLAATEPKR